MPKQPDDSDRIRFTRPGEPDAIDDEQLLALYAYQSGPSRCQLRANAIISLDGGATTDGTSGGLGGAGDRRLFGVLRELADVIVVGAGTARAENYAGAQMTVTQRQNRQNRGQSEIPPIALVTRSGRLDHDLPVLTRTEIPPLVLTCTDAAPGARARLGTAADVLDCSGNDPGEVDPAAVLAVLTGRGLLRALCEGGPTLLGTFVERDLLDELCLTTAPVLVGGASPRIAAGAGNVLTRLRRAHLITDTDGYLYGRYTRVS